MRIFLGFITSLFTTQTHLSTQSDARLTVDRVHCYKQTVPEIHSPLIITRTQLNCYSQFTHSVYICAYTIMTSGISSATWSVGRNPLWRRAKADESSYDTIHCNMSTTITQYLYAAHGTNTAIHNINTPSTPAVPNCWCSKGSAPYWSNRPFLIFDIRALWRSVLSARAPEC